MPEWAGADLSEVESGGRMTMLARMTGRNEKRLPLRAAMAVTGVAAGD